MQPNARLPVTILTGFLGSGKTTLLRWLLADPKMARTAVVINELGEIGLDHLLVRSVLESAVVLQNGCICCTLRTDLRQGLRDLIDGRAAGTFPDFDRVVIETTGLADPAPVGQTLLLDPMLRHQVRLDDDFHPWYARLGDSWTKIDYSKKARDWMQPWRAGKQVDFVELPASWHLDDVPPVTFVKAFPNSHGWITGRQLEEIWKDQFDWVYRTFDYAVFPLTIHPDGAGKPHVLMLLERLVDYIMRHSGVRMVTFAEMAADFRHRAPFGSGKGPGGKGGL